MSQAGISNKSLAPGSCSINLVAGPGIEITGSPVTCGGSATISAAGGQPNAFISLVDDFFPSGISAGGSIGSQLGWFNLNNTSIGTTLSSSHPGIAILNSSEGNNGLVLQDTNNNKGFLFGGGVLSCNFVFNLVTLSNGTNRYIAQIGMSDGVSGTFPNSPVNGVYFTYSDNVNSGNWVINCTSASVTTSTNTSVAGSTSFANFGFTVNAAGTSVTFTINSVSVGTITTHIPTVAINPFVAEIQSIGSPPTSYLDLFYLQQTLTTPR